MRPKVGISKRSSGLLVQTSFLTCEGKKVAVFQLNVQNTISLQETYAGTMKMGKYAIKYALARMRFFVGQDVRNLLETE